MKRRIQRAFLDLEPLLGDSLDPLKDGEAMHLPPGKRLQNEEVERSAQQSDIRALLRCVRGVAWHALSKPKILRLRYDRAPSASSANIRPEHRPD